ncbi:MAG: nitroreductase [Desulfarculus sp.]|jgi:nitroreductase|nr:MAG: nitroreductase [Desulfarculus sp.]
MDVRKAIYKRRSVRSFKQKPLDQQVLRELIDAARVGPSAANRQPLQYVVVTEPGLCQQVFDCLKWAAYTAPRGVPQPGFTPTAYVAICVKKDLALAVGAKYDLGAAAQTILLLATAQGLGTCWIKTMDAPRLSQILAVPEGVELDSVVALGLPAEEPEQVDLEPGQEGLEAIKYWRDDKDQQFVPKRNLADILFWNKYSG